MSSSQHEDAPTPVAGNVVTEENRQDGMTAREREHYLSQLSLLAQDADSRDERLLACPRNH